MLGVLTGFAVVWIIILTGYAIGRLKVLGDNAQTVLSRLAFFVASPALLLTTLSDADLPTVFSLPLLVAAASALATGGLYVLATRWWLRRPLPETLVSAMSSSLVNAANLGLPICVYVLGDAAYIAPVLIFQLAFFTPFFLMMLDSATSGRRTSVAVFAGQVIRNPIVVGSLIGLFLAATGLRLPEIIHEPVALIAGAAVPAMLLAFGLSLVGSRPLDAGGGRRADVILASGFKLLLQPMLAYLLARFALGMEGHLLFAVVVTAALPTAQNVFVAASRYGEGVLVAKDTVLLTTVASLPVLVLAAALLT
ncbi:MULTISPECIES: AEC family transporter [unclassified Arthrobacter]|uniref:AEC family transporter n=1 Tax=unclassified Arthrobacter TaxID=235627 RepID=UPI001D157889|nr:MULTISPECIES: AEC family transporter [unclassified Arthrobacter]MCC3275165.1 AEC family transporter [Arthrobacter sp. zg-Y20]MCC9176612.1 AEC family transporter [Arthrobacter sp. zg-Y750]MDK1315322.1 AEC family transporter [Arthrobacter sp. zg.Y20]WIB05744.1 AEC family transporter [Arthrobacter sp. zg-Y20]